MQLPAALGAQGRAGLSQVVEPCLRRYAPYRRFRNNPDLFYTNSQTIQSELWKQSSRSRDYHFGDLQNCEIDDRLQMLWLSEEPQSHVLKSFYNVRSKQTIDFGAFLELAKATDSRLGMHPRTKWLRWARVHEPFNVLNNAIWHIDPFKPHFDY